VVIKAIVHQKLFPYAKKHLRDYIKSEIPKWAKVVKASGAKVE
jgi:methionine salvage enolase-phosphatase E1